MAEDWKGESDSPRVPSIFGHLFRDPTPEEKAQMEARKAESDAEAAAAALTLPGFKRLPCTKCGGERVKVLYCPGKEGTYTCAARTLAGDGEHMHWICKACRFTWFTRTRDDSDHAGASR